MLMPEAYAVLDPKRSDCPYPYKELTGCGIGFKLVQAYSQKNNIPFEAIEQYIDLVAISIAADIVPITGENRILTYYGLKKINASPRMGIQNILQVSNYQKEVSVNEVVFLIAPRINAAGRIEHGKQAVELLTTQNAGTAKLRSADINDHNVTRKELDQSITEQALALIAQDKKFIERKSTVVFNSKWHKGVIGIVASRLTDHYYRPTIVLTESNGIVAGSARSVKDFDIHAAIEACSDLLEQYGGHKYAAGLTLKKENVERFRERFDEVVSTSIPEHSLIPEIEIDAEAQLADFTPAFFNVMKQFAPFGPGNMAPVFLVKNVYDTGYGKVVGNNHLKLFLRHSNSTHRGFGAIAFQQGHNFSLIEKNAPIDICIHLEENFFNGKSSLQLNVKDMRKADEAKSDL
jgi:single-stranded-DNA-specific exonuclease